jgi:RNA polymerase sigma-70 factor, ECF subfamily
VETSLTWLGRLVQAPTGSDWNRLQELYAPLIIRWLTRASIPESDREDLCQEVLVVVVRRVKEFEHRGPGAFRAWLRGILANHIKTYHRHRVHTCDLDFEQLTDDRSELSKQWDREHDQFLALRVMSIVKGDFTPTTWAAFQRQVIDGETPTEVARALNLSLNSVLVAKCRVLKRLREELQMLVE